MHSIIKLAAGLAAIATPLASAGPFRSNGLVSHTVDVSLGCPRREVDGNLHVHVPPEAACYNTFDGPLGSIPTYDQEKCQELTAKWTDVRWIVEQQALNMWKYWTNATCTPTDDPTNSCTLGYYGVYVIMAQTHDHIVAGINATVLSPTRDGLSHKIAGINFARANSLRLVIRNTGHDFAGRSTGYGSLIINTHSLQDIQFHKSWNGPGKYRGGAVTLAAGVQGGTILAACNAQSPHITMVTGECSTVGITGGWIAGGGHGPLSSLYGMGADNALQFEVITAHGKFVTANEKENKDLFFALRGGGPSTYGVVISATFRTYEDIISAGATLFINSTHTSDENLIWEGTRIFHKWSNHFVDNGLYAYFEIYPFSSRVVPFVAVGKTKAELSEILKPMVDELNAADVPFELMTKDYKTNYDLYVDLFEDVQAGLHVLTGGWGFTHEDVEKNNDGIVEAFRKVQSPREDMQYSGVIIDHLFKPDHGRPKSDAALNPRWRNSTSFTISVFPAPWNATQAEKDDYQHVLTDLVDGALKEAGPSGYAYINEADPLLPNWSEHFWGPVYPKLKLIRRKWDPDMVFFAISTVGTEKWEVIEGNTRLCKRLD